MQPHATAQLDSTVPGKLVTAAGVATVKG